MSALQERTRTQLALLYEQPNVKGPAVYFHPTAIQSDRVGMDPLLFFFFFLIGSELELAKCKLTQICLHLVLLRGELAL